MIRPAVQNDIPQLARLHMRVGEPGEHSLDEVRRAYECYFPQIYFDQPWYDERMPSLVSEETDGRITGLLAVVARTMSYQGTPVRMAVSSRMSVDPESRSKLAGVQLLKTFFNGPQDISVADIGNSTSQKIWEALGGTTAPLYSLYWTRLIRPCRVALAKIGQQGGLLGKLGWTTTPFAHVLDKLAGQLPTSRFRFEASNYRSEDLTPDLFRKNYTNFTKDDTLRPIYDEASVGWLWRRFGNMWDDGEVYKIVLKNNCDEVIGWYIYNLDPSGIGQVAQIAASKSSITDVLEHLFHHAFNHGAIALSGRVQPRFLRELSQFYCGFHARDKIALIHASNPELLRPFERGEACLTQLEGEGCLYMAIDPPTSQVSDLKQYADSIPVTSGSIVEPDIDRVQELIAQVTE